MSQSQIQQKDLHSLGRWPLAAFAARCARRILPLYRKLNVRSPEHLVTIARAIDLAERRAALGDAEIEKVMTDLLSNYELDALVETLGIIQNAAQNTKADAAGGSPDDPFWIESNAYTCAVQAAQMAICASFNDDFRELGTPDGEILSPAICAEQAYQAAVNVSDKAREKLIEAILLDFNIAKSINKAKTDKSGVAPEVFGAFWPKGKPTDWPDSETPKFKPRARLMTLLGDQLIRDSGIAVFELVKNAYDADATFCKIFLKNIDQKGDSTEIVVQDDGCGMDLNTVMNVWLEPGTDMRKQQREALKRTPRFNRLPLGEKGVGRFAVHKLGRKTEMVTRKADCEEVVVTIDWNIFTNTTYLSDVPINVITRPPEVFLDGKTGTLIRITDLTESPWTRGLVRSLYRAVTSICSPFQRPEEFLPEVILEGSNKLDWLKGLLVVTDAIESAPFCFKAKIQNGILDYKYEFKPGHKLTRVEPRISSNKMPIMALSDSGENEGVALDPTTIGTVEIEFYIFDRSSQILKLTASDPKGLKDFLDQNGGVRVYRDGIRVFDYGEPGNDWLNLGVEG